MTEAHRYSPVIKTHDDPSDRAALLNCPRCDAELLHHTTVTVYDRPEDGAAVVKTKVSGGRITVEPAASGAGNPSSRRDGIAIDFRCEGCGSDPITLTIAQHKGSTEIGWVYEVNDAD